LTPHLPTQQATPKSDQKESHERLERKSLCPIDNIKAISTMRISDPAPVAIDIKPRRYRGVHCIRLVELSRYAAKAGAGWKAPVQVGSSF
jgi:hypothetical protein